MFKNIFSSAVLERFLGLALSHRLFIGASVTAAIVGTTVYQAANEPTESSTEFSEMSSTADQKNNLNGQRGSRNSDSDLDAAFDDGTSNFRFGKNSKRDQFNTNSSSSRNGVSRGNESSNNSFAGRSGSQSSRGGLFNANNSLNNGTREQTRPFRQPDSSVAGNPAADRASSPSESIIGSNNTAPATTTNNSAVTPDAGGGVFPTVPESDGTVAARLVFTSQVPASVVAGQIIQPSLEIQDADGRLVTTGPDSAATVTLKLQTGAGNLHGTLIKKAVGGVVSFTQAEAVYLDIVGTKKIVATKLNTTGQGGTEALNTESSTFTVVNAEAASMNFTTQPTGDVRTIYHIPMALELRDRFSNLVTEGADADSSVTLSLHNGTGALTGNVTKNFTDGVVQFGSTENVAVTMPGNKVIKATKVSNAAMGGSGQLTAYTSTFNAFVGAADEMRFSLQPASSIIAGDPISVTIELVDELGNVVNMGTDSTAQVTLTIQSGSGSILGTVTKAAVAGVATFTAADGIYIDTVGTKIIRATKQDLSMTDGSGPLFVDSNSFDITHASAAQMVYTTEPADNTVAGTALLPVIEIRDVYGNTVTTGADATANVTLAMISGTGVLSGTLMKPAVAGVVSFIPADIVAIDLVGAKVLQATKEDLSLSSGTASLTVDSVSFDIVHAPASQMVYTTQPINNTIAGTDLLPVIEIRDSFGNVVLSGVDSTANVTISIQSGTGVLSGTMTKAAVNGVVSFTAADNLAIDLIGTKTLRATKLDTTGSGGTTSVTVDSDPFDIVHAPASQIVYTTQPADNTIAGTDLLPILEIRDSFGNIVTSGADSTASVTLTLQSGSGALSGSVTKAAVAGVITFDAADDVAVDIIGSKTLRATKADTTGAGGTVSRQVDSDPFTIIHAPASQLVFSTQPVDTPAGSDILPVIRIHDSFGNLVTTGPDATTNVTLSLQSGTGAIYGTVSKAAVAGIVTYVDADNVYIDMVGTKTIRATKDDTTGSSGTASVFADSVNFDILVGLATKLVYTTQPVNTIAGEDILPVIEVRDVFDNVVTTGPDSTANVTLSLQSGSGILSGTLTKAAVGGVITFTGTDNVAINIVGTKTLRASKASTVGSGGAGVLTEDSSNFDILHAAASQIVYTTQPVNTVAGSDILPVLEIRDSFGNIITSGPDSTANVTFSIQTGTGTLSGAITKAAVAGVLTIDASDDLAIDIIGTKVLRATKADTTGASGTAAVFVDSNNFVITHAPASQLVYTTQPVNTVAGQDILPVLNILDTYGNLVTTGADATASVTLTLQSGSGSLTGNVTKSAVGGVITYTGADNIHIEVVGTKVLRATKADTTGGGGTASVFVDSNNFDILVAPANKLVYTTQPVNTIAGEDLLPVIEIRDVFDNVVTTGADSTASVTLTLQSGTGALSGTVTKSAVAGIVTFDGADNTYINLVGAKTLRASKQDTSGGGGTGVITQDSASFNITHAAASQMVYTTQPVNTPAGSDLLPILEIRDTFGNLVTTGVDATTDVTLSLQSGTGSLYGTVTKAAVGGVVTYVGADNVTIDLVGTKVLRATKLDTTGSGGTASVFVDSNNFDILVGVATKLVYTTQPANNTVAGADLLPVIEIRDFFDNVVTTGADSNANVTLTLQSGSGVLSGTITKTAVAGVVTFAGADDVYINLVGTKALRATKADRSGLGGAGVLTEDSANFDIIHAPASQIVYTTQPVNTVSGEDILPAFEIRDTFGNIVTTGADSTANVTLSKQTGTGTLTGTLTKAAVAGVVSFDAADNVAIDIVGTKTLRATKADTTGTGGTASVFADSNNFDIVVGLATKLVFTTQPANNTVAGTDLLPVIEIRDNFDNVVTTGADSTANVTLSLQSGSGVLGGTVTKAAVAGVITFGAADDIAIDLVGAKTLRASKADMSGSGGAGVLTEDSVSFNIVHAPASQIVYTTQPVDTVSGADILPILEIRDAFGNLVTSGADATANVTLSKQAGSGVLSGTLTKPAVGGVITFDAADDVAIDLVGTKTLRATKANTTGTGGTASVFVDSNNFDILVGAATQLVYTTQPATSVAGVHLLPVLEIRDLFGNIVTTGADATADVTLSLQSGTGTLAGTLTKSAVAGVVSFTAAEAVYLDLVGAKTIRASKADMSGFGGSGILTVDSNSFNITHAPASQMVYTTQPVNTVAGQDILPILEIRDTFGNIVTSGADSTVNVTLSLQSGTGTLSGTLVKAAVAGVITFTGADNVAIDVVGTKVLRASKPDTTGSGGTVALNVDSNNFDILVGAATQLVFTTQPANNTVAGDDLLPVIEIRDSLNNIVTTGVDATANVTLSLQSGSGAIFGTVTKAAVAGIVTFDAADNVYINLVGAKTIRASKADLSGSGGAGVLTQDSVSFNIVHAPASQLVYTTQPVNTVSGADILPVLEVRDTFGNVVTSGADATADITLSLQAGTGVLSGTLTKSAVAGVITFNGADNVAIDLVGTKTLRATKADTTGSSGTVSIFVDSNNFDILVGAATQLVFTTEPVDSIAGDDLLPVIEIRDAFNNVVTSGVDSTANVTLSLFSGTGALSGTITKAAVAGVITFTGADNVYINLVGAKTLRATKADLSGSGGAGVLTEDSASFNINHAPASQLVYTTQPVDTPAGSDLLPVLNIRDSFGNLITSGADATANVTLSLQSGTGTLYGTVTKAAVGGVITYGAGDNVTIDLVGTKTLRATKADTTGSGGTGVLTVDSNNFDILVGVATKLVYTTQPSNNTVAGADLLPVIEIRDFFDNVMTTGADATANVTLTLETGTGALAGTVTKAAVGGIVTFDASDDVYINLVGAKTLRATKADRTGLGGAGVLTEDSVSFNIVHAPASQIVYTTQPVDTVAGFDILPAFEIRDTFGNLVTSGSDATANVTLSKQTGTGTLSGILTKAAVGGVVSFGASDDVAIDLVGAKTLRATKADTTGTGGTIARTVDSVSFNITFGAATKLVYTTQPANNTVAGTDLLPVIEIRDAFENVITSGPDSNADVTLSLQSGTGVLSGTVTKAAVAGIVTIGGADNLAIDLVGAKTLRASKADRTGLGGAGVLTEDSVSFNIVHAPASQLVYATQPVDTIAGADILPVVEIQDAFGNIVTSGADATTTLTLSLQTGTGVLSGTVAKAAVAGVVTFAGADNVAINLVGSKVLRVTKPDTTGTGGTVSINEDSSSFNILHGLATQLSFATQPVNTPAGNDLLPVIHILDSQGNLVTSGTDATTNVTLNLQTGTGTLYGTMTKAAVGGVVTFDAADDLTIDLVGAKTLRATKPDNTGTGGAGILTVDSNSFNILVGVATKLVYTTQPANNTVAGADLLPVIEIRDFFDNVVTSGADATANVTLSLQSGTGALSGTVTKAAVAGIVTFAAGDNVYIDLVGAKTLRATKADLSGSGGAGVLTEDSASFTIVHAPASQLVYTTEPVNTEAGADLLPVIEIRDSFGNLITSGADATANVTLSKQAGTGTLSGTLTKAAVGGVVTFLGTDNVAIDVVGTKTLRATKASTTGSGGVGILTQDSANFDILLGSATQLVFTTQPANNTIAGADLLPVIEIRDSLGNVITTGVDSTANVTLSLFSGTGVLSGTLTKAAVAGVVTFGAADDVYIDLVGAKTIRATKADLSGSGGAGALTQDSASFNIVHAPASSIAYTTQPANTVTMGDLLPALQIVDAFGNIITSGPDATVNVTLSLQSGTGVLSGTVTKAAVAGVISFVGTDNVAIDLVGTKTLRASKADTTGGGGTGVLTVDSNNFDILVGAATQLVYTTQPANSIAGANLLPVLEIRDISGNIVNTGVDATANVTLSLFSGTGVLSGTLTKAAVAGVVSFTATEAVSINLIGAKVIRAAKADLSGSGGSGALTVDSNSFNITHAPASQIVYTTQPANTVAGADLVPVLQIRDSFGNIVSTGADATTNVTLSLQTGTGVLSGTVVKAAVGGVITYGAADDVAINLTGAKVLRATKDDTTGTGGTAAVFVDSNSFNILAGAATQLVFTTEPANNTIAGDDLLPVIEIQDSLGNLVTSGVDATANVTLSLFSGTGALSGTVTKAAVGGIVTFGGADNVYINLVGSKTLRATKADLSGSGGAGVLTEDSASFDILHAPAATLVFTTQPTNTVASADILPVITIRDTFGNTVTSGPDSTVNVTMSLQSGTGTLSGTVTKAAVAGVATWGAADDLAINLTGAKTLRASKADTTGSSGTGVLTVDSNAFNITPGVATQLVFTTQPANNTVAGADLLPVIEIRDANNNVVSSGTDATATVTLSLTTGTGVLSGTVAKAAVGGVVTFTATESVDINLVGSKQLTATKADLSGSGGAGTLTQTSNSFTIVHGPAFQLVFSTQPANNTMATSNLLPVVEVQDSYGNIVTSGADSTVNITMTLQTGTGVLSGTTVKAAVAGVASFTATEALSINLTGSKVLRATKPDTTGSGGTIARTVDSNSFFIISGPATQLVYTTQPANNTPAGGNLLPVLEIRDAGGNVVTTGPDLTANVTLSLFSGTGTLSGTVTKAAVNGVVTFTATEAVYIDLIGAKVLQASKADTTGGGGTGALTVNSNSFTIIHGAATQMAYTLPPGSSLASQVSFGVAVEILDAFGNRVTTGPDATANVTVSTPTAPGALTNAGCGVSDVAVTFGGTKTVASVGGVATFSGLTLNVAGNYVMRATKADTTGGGGTISRLVDSSSFALQSGTITAMYWRNSAGTATNPDATRLAAQTFTTGGVILCDATGNASTSTTDTVTFAILDADLQPNPTGDDLHGNPQAIVSGGMAMLSSSTASIYLAGTGYYLTATHDATGVVADNTAASVTVSPADWSTLAFTVVTPTWPDNTNVLPAVRAQVSDGYGNFRTSGCSGNANLTLETNPGGSLLGTTTVALSAGCVASWTAVRVDIAAGEVSGFQLRGTSTGLFCTANTATCTGVSEEFSVTTSPGLNLMTAFEMLGTGVGNATVQTTSDVTKTIFNPNWFSGTTTFGLEVVATNDSTNKDATIALVDNLGGATNVVTVPKNNSTLRRFYATFTPNFGISEYRLRIPKIPAGNANDVKIYAARIIVTQASTQAYATALNVPLVHDTHTTTYLANVLGEAAVDSTTNTSFTQGAANKYSIWQYNAAEFDEIINPGIKFYAVLAPSVSTARAYAELYNLTANASVAGTEISIGGTTNGNLASTDWLSPSVLTDGHRYEVRIRTNSGASAAKIQRAGLIFKMRNLTKYSSMWRVANNINATATGANYASRTNFNYSNFSSPTSTFECTGVDVSNGLTVNLVNFGNTDVNGTVTAMGSALDFSSTKDLLSTSVTPAGTLSFGTRINGAPGQLNLSSCYIKVKN